MFRQAQHDSKNGRRCFGKLNIKACCQSEPAEDGLQSKFSP